MKRFVLAPLAVLFSWLVLAVAPAAAQNIYPYQQPRYGPGYTTPLSPYLNLLIPGNTAVNYYALVEPQFQRRQYRNQTNQTLQGIVNQLPSPPGINEEDMDAPLPAAGHPTAFNYTGTYFNNGIGGQAISPSSQRRAGPAGSGQRLGQRPGMGGGGTWPNMRTGMGAMGR